MRIFYIILSFCLISSTFAAEPDKKLHVNCLYPTILILNGSNQGGTGFVVRSEKVGSIYNNIAITCAHVMNSEDSEYFVKVGNYEDWSRLKNYSTYPCTVYASDINKDLAILVFSSEKPVLTAELDFDAKYYIGNDVLRIGCGMLDEPRLDYGKITAIRTTVVNSPIKDTLRISIPTVHGDSGGPVYLDHKVIGIAQAIRIFSGGRQAIYHMTYAIPITRIKIWNNEINNSIDFVFNKNKPLPVMIYFYNNLKNFTLRGIE